MDMDTIGIVSTGEMGSSIARTVQRNGLRAITTLEGRSEQTRANARDAGVDDVTPDVLVREADIVLSVVVSDAVPDVVRLVAESANDADEPVLLADLNPVAPATLRSIATEYDDRVDVVDGCIIGPASDLSGATFHFSGPRAVDAATLDDYGLTTNVLGGHVGQASGLKLCYAGMTKGLSVLGMDLLLGAVALDIEADVVDLYEAGVPGIVPFLDGRLPSNPKRAERRAQELDELATMLDETGIDDSFARAGSERLHWLGSLGLDTDEAADAVATAREVARAIDR